MTRDEMNVRWKDGSSSTVEIDQTGTHWTYLCGRDVNIDRDSFQVTGGRRLDCPACGRRCGRSAGGTGQRTPRGSRRPSCETPWAARRLGRTAVRPDGPPASAVPRQTPARRAAPPRRNERPRVRIRPGPGPASVAADSREPPATGNPTSRRTGPAASPDNPTRWPLKCRNASPMTAFGAYRLSP